MRIVLKAVSLEEALCDGPERGQDRSRGPAGYAIRQIAAGEDAPGARAAAVLPIERANVGHILRFGISRECASHVAAITWANVHAAKLSAMRVEAARSTVAMSLVLEEGGYRRTITPVRLSDFDIPQFIGGTVAATYTLTFGAWPT